MSVFLKLLLPLHPIMHKNVEEITISLIIPVYNVSKYIERCLKSVIKQTYNHFECILVDDASPDDSIAICERMIAVYEGPIKFRILHHEQNRGLSAARNTGIDAAKGDYILFIDSDDIISNDCVQKLMAPILKDNSIDIVHGQWMVFSDNCSMVLPQIRNQKSVDLFPRETVRNFFYNEEPRFTTTAWNKLISKDFLIRNNLRFREGQLWEDVLWWFFVMKHLNHLYIIPDFTYFYNKRSDSINKGTPEEERHWHQSMVSGIISANFTSGDESREAAHYVLGFLHHYIRLSKNKDLHDTARRFAKALPLSKYPRERLLLWAVVALPHNKTGKDIFKWLSKK